MEIPKKIKDEIWEYCRINDIPNIDEFILKMVNQGFTVEKYGAAPAAKERVVEKIVEKIVEVHVDKIIEKIVEVPVEKEVYITDNSQVKDLAEQITKLESDRNYYKLEMERFELEWNNTLQKLEIEQTKNKKKDIYGE
jgi:hypothetical protein